MVLSENYQKAIQNLADAIYVCDEAGFITNYNRAAAELWGREPEAGKEKYSGAVKVISKEGVEIPVEQLPVARSLKQNKAVQGMELVIWRPDGTIRKVVQYTSPVYDASGQIAGAINRMVDVTWH